MKPDDKFPEEMLDAIREAAVKARDAAHDLAVLICETRCKLPFRFDHEMRWWQSAAIDFNIDADSIADRAEELADADGETAEGGQE
jgi:hypothetical protein